VIHPDVSQLVYRLPAMLRPIVLVELKGIEQPDAQKQHIITRYEGLLGAHVDTEAYLADYEAWRRDAANGHQGGVTTVRKQRMGLLPAADPAGKKWKPDFKAPLNRAVFPKWGKVPVYVPPLNRYMSPLVRGAIIAIGDVVDHLGDFVVPRAWLAEQVGASERKAYAALQTLRAAGLIEPRIQGDRHQATVWRYAEVAKVDMARARKVLQAARSRAAEKAEKIRKKAEATA
jgi:hypothetical protein